VNLDQKRARQALNNITQVEQNTHVNRKEFSSLSRSLPAMLQVNGLGQTLAFLKSKSASSLSHEILYGHFSFWLNEIIRDGEPGDFLDYIVDQSTYIYRHAGDEAIEFSIWLRRFAEAKGWD